MSKAETKTEDAVVVDAPSFKSAGTFKAPVEIHRPGKTPEKIAFTFKHKTRDEAKAFDQKLKDGAITDEEIILDLASGWGYAEPFNTKSVAELVQDRAGVVRPILKTYFAELSGATLGN